MRIGACIIDQYDTDSYPTVIEYNEASAGTPYWRATGVESLPFLSAFKQVAGFDATPTAPSIVPLQTYFLWQLWNPQRTVQPPGAVPDIRIHVKGTFMITNEWADPSTYPANLGFNGVPAAKFLLDDSYVFPSSVTSSTTYFNTRFIQATSDFPSLSTSKPGWWLTPLMGGTNYFAYRLPDFKLNTDPTVHTGTGIHAVPTSFAATDSWDMIRTWYSYDASNPFQVSLEFKTPSGSWVAYCHNTGINDPATAVQGGVHCPVQFSFNPTPSNWASAWQNKLSAISPLTFTGGNRLTVGGINFTNDPRSLRFNPWVYDADYGGELSLWPPSQQPGGYGAGHSPSTASSSIATAPYPTGTLLSAGRGAQEIPRIFNDPTLVSPNEGSFYFPARLARNVGSNDSTNQNSVYPDRDGVQRWADSGLYGTTSGTSGGNPFENAADRPVILNRPFQSVAELGYVFRDDPWRSLDFFTSNSADAALLDLFSLADEGAVSAGKINLNTRVATCLQAALAGVIQEPVSAQALSGANAQTLAKNLVAFTTGASGPLLDSSQLATAFLATTGTTAAPLIKTTREAVIRGLASVGQTRTWNLLVDVIAQSGRYGPVAIARQDLSQFTVEGERHYWAHIAIDRFTGEVVDMQLEPVNE